MVMMNKLYHDDQIDLVMILREGFTKKSCCSFGFCPNEVGGKGGDCPIFCYLFISAFLVNKMSLFPPK